MLPLNAFIKNRIHKSAARPHQDGVILAIIPVILLILGLFVAYMTRSVNLPHFYKEQETIERMERVFNALSAHVQRYHRLPCPALPDNSGAEPFGFEEGSGGAGNNIPASCNNSIGLIPFNTLGLPEDDSRDGWGRYISYAISPTFGVNPVVLRYPSNPAIPVLTDRLPRAHNAANMRVHEECRTPAWIDGSKGGFVGKNGVNYTIPGGPVIAARNPWKARFCCPSITPGAIDETTDIIINDNGVNTPQRGGFAGDYAAADTPAGAPPFSNIETVAVALISHGQNGSGAYRGGTSAARVATPAGDFSAAERENTDDDRNFVAQPRVLGNNAANYYDDIVAYRTQHQIYSQLGNADCSTPF